MPDYKQQGAQQEGQEQEKTSATGESFGSKSFLELFTPKVLVIFLVFAVLVFISGLILSQTSFLTQDQEDLNSQRQDSGATDENANQTPSGQDPLEDTGEKLFGFSLVKPVFAQYARPEQAVSPELPAITPKVDELMNLSAFEEAGLSLSADQAKALEEQGFFLADEDVLGEQTFGNDDFADLYKTFSGNRQEHYREPDDALFISSDAALHLYHILIDRSFQKIEEEKFQPMLKQMTRALFADSMGKYQEADEGLLKDTYSRLAAYYLIPLVVLDSADLSATDLSPEDFGTYAEYLEAQVQARETASQQDLEFSLDAPVYGGYELDDFIFQTARQELDLIQDSQGVSPSALFTPLRPDFENDYSQFKPRSHYTKNDILKSYFIAMMWYGRMGFTLDSPELTRDAIAITGQINTLKAGDGNISDMYATLSSAIEFFVGEVDDLTPYQYTDLMQKHFGSQITTDELSDQDMLDGFIQKAIKELPIPRIVSEVVYKYDDGGERDKLLKSLMQFRFMGQRFTPDAYVLNQLTQGVGAPDPETGQNLPSMTTALMPIKVISPDNQVVDQYVNSWVEANAPLSDRIIDKKLSQLINEFSGFSQGTWTQNIYWNWLNTYRSLLAGYGEGYPYFMTTDNWQRKNLGTVLGSYTELKHDTLLYAKQSYAELGGGGNLPEEIPPVPKGYVEADPVFWSRITALAEMTQNGLEERDLMPEYYGDRYESFADICRFYSELARKQLADQDITDDEFERLRQSGYVFAELTDPLPGKSLTNKERRAGIIADIHTDAVKSQILYEATGKPYIIYVAVKDKNGARLTRGLVFKHYEFTGPLDERYADEDWQAKVYEGQDDLPLVDEWSQSIVR